MYNSVVCRSVFVKIVSVLLSQVVLRDLARIHSQYLGKTEWLSSQPWLETKEGRRMVAMAALRQAMVDHARLEFPEMWTEERYVSLVGQTYQD